ncbi:hemerythrin domain-containing protein [Nonomuraea sp. NPDC050310]|uniref:hemerythrin domain-containing protein n=1 Tax=unclassified Nonomuraea TaxID=2593643 RepID=UPI0033E2FC4B
MADDVITLIMADHRKVEELFTRLEAGKGDARAIVAELFALLTAHARAEEDIVYPGLDAHHGLVEHKEAEVLLNTLKRAEPGSAAFVNAHKLLAASVGHHVQEEESTLLPLLARTTDAKRLRSLATAFRQRREQELRALTTPTDGRLTKAELYERAQQAGISGRSRMTKKELVKALADARP